MPLNATQAAIRYAVVTGANKGIGLETVRKLANEGVTVVLTSRNETRGMDAIRLLQESGLPNVLFHQLDVTDPQSIESLAKFVAAEFKRLDILVNNAAVLGAAVDEDGLKALNVESETQLAGMDVLKIIHVAKTSYEMVKECLDTNYYGARNVTEALLPLLQLSTSGARIVNVCSKAGGLKHIRSEQIWKELGDVDTITEEKIDGILQKVWNCVDDQFLKLKYLGIRYSGNNCLVEWTADSSHFPSLEHIYLYGLKKMEEISPEIGEIPSLRLIQVIRCCDTVEKWATAIQEEQRSFGNHDLIVRIKSRL